MISELSKSYKNFKSVYDLAEEDNENSFWDKVPIDANYDDTSKQSTTTLVKKHELAKKKSMMLAKKIENHTESKNNNKLCLLWIVAILVLSATSLVIWGLIWRFTRNTEKKLLRQETRDAIENSEYVPLFLNIPGTGSSLIPCALSSCLGLQETKLDGIENVSMLFILIILQTSN